MTEKLHLGDIVMAIGASTDSNYGAQFELPGTYSATASFELLEKASLSARQHGFPYMVGNVLSSDVFYSDTEDRSMKWTKMGILAAEMESYALYCNAARAGVDALGIFSVSDSIVTGEAMSAQDRQTSFTNMMTVALEIAAETV